MPGAAVWEQCQDTVSKAAQVGLKYVAIKAPAAKTTEDVVFLNIFVKHIGMMVPPGVRTVHESISAHQRLLAVMEARLLVVTPVTEEDWKQSLRDNAWQRRLLAFKQHLSSSNLAESAPDFVKTQHKWVEDLQANVCTHTLGLLR